MLTGFVFEIDALFKRSNCSIFLVKISTKSLGLFENLSVCFPTSVGLKIGQFLSKFLPKKCGVIIWQEVWCSSIEFIFYPIKLREESTENFICKIILLLKGFIVF